MDIVDMAQHQEEQSRAIAIARQRQRAASAERRSVGLPACCDDCGADIEPGRLSVLPETPICAYCAHQREVRRGR